MAGGATEVDDEEGEGEAVTEECDDEDDEEKDIEVAGDGILATTSVDISCGTDAWLRD